MTHPEGCIAQCILQPEFPLALTLLTCLAQVISFAGWQKHVTISFFFYADARLYEGGSTLVIVSHFRLLLNAVNFNADSAVGSNAFGSRNLDHVEEADIEAGQILTALKSSPSPIRSQFPPYSISFMQCNWLWHWSYTHPRMQSLCVCVAHVNSFVRLFCLSCNLHLTLPAIPLCVCALHMSSLSHTLLPEPQPALDPQTQKPSHQQPQILELSIPARMRR